MSRIKSGFLVESMTGTQAAIGASALIGFFVLWFLWAAVGHDILCWFENHSGTGSWAQAIFGGLAIIVALIIPYISRAQSIKDKYNTNILIAKNNFDAEIRRLIRLVEHLKMKKIVIENNQNSIGIQNIDWIDVYLGTIEVYQFSNPNIVNQFIILGNNYSSRLGYILSSFDTIYKSLVSHKLENKIIPNTVEKINGFRLVSVINSNLVSLERQIFELSEDYSFKHHDSKDVFLMDKAQNY